MNSQFMNMLDKNDYTTFLIEKHNLVRRILPEKVLRDLKEKLAERREHLRVQTRQLMKLEQVLYRVDFENEIENEEFILKHIEPVKKEKKKKKTKRKSRKQAKTSPKPSD